MREIILKIEKLSVYRQRRVLALSDIDFEAEKGSTLGVLGPNGAGKSTLLDTLSGFLRPENGAIQFLGQRIDGRPPHEVASRGMVQVSQSRDLFTALSVLDNLRLGASVRATSRRRKNIARIFEYFPKLADRRKQTAGTLSGGEQQMLAIGRALMAEPEVLLLDEPSAGLAPAILIEIERILKQLKDSGLTMILVEQNLAFAARMLDRFILLQSGKIIARGDASALSQAEAFLMNHYF